MSTSESSHFLKLLQRVHGNAALAAEGEFWGVPYSRIDHYERYFHLPKGYFREYCDIVEQNGRTPFTLDVGSYLTALVSLKVPGIAMALTKKGKSGMGDIFVIKKDNRSLLARDILRKSSWKRLHEIMRERGIEEGFPLVMARPISTNRMYVSPQMYGWVLREIVSVMDPRGSLAILQIPEVFKQTHKDLFTEFIARMRSIEGVDASLTPERGSGLILQITNQTAKQNILQLLS